MKNRTKKIPNDTVKTQTCEKSFSYKICNMRRTLGAVVI